MFVKKIIFIFILISANLLLAQQNSKRISDRYIKENIAVFEIKDASSGYGKDLGKKLTSLIENSLTRMNRFNIVDRKNLDKYLKEMEITEEIEIGYYKNIIENYNERDREYFKNNMPLMLDAKVVSTLNCDKTINKLLLNFDDFYSLYPYITGTYLASIALSIAREDDRFLDEMKYITENISKLDASYIFNSLGLDIDRMNKNAKRYNKTKKN